MSEDKDTEKEKDKGFRIDSGRDVGRPPTPKAIAAQSQARNSFAGIVILGGILLLLSIALFISLACRPDHVKDLLIIIGTISGYVAGSLSFARKDEK